MTQCDGRNAAAVLNEKSLASTQIEVTVPHMQVVMANARLRQPDQHFSAGWLRGVAQHTLQRAPVFDDGVAQQESAPACLQAIAEHERAAGAPSAHRPHPVRCETVFATV